MEAYLDRYCFDLPTQPIAGCKVLVTGASGYIGGELIPELVARGYQVRVMVRTFSSEYKERWPSVDIVVANVLKYEELVEAMKGIDCAYYLIHSMHNPGDFKKIDLEAATNFQRSSDVNNLKKIIYLGSLGNADVDLSDHLSSRIQVAEQLQKSKASLTFLRSAVIIGSGSASYKMINNIVTKCPFFIFPSWANSNCQPIAVRDVIKYLVGSMEHDQTEGKVFDVGGKDILSYKNMLKIQAKVLNKKRIFIDSPFSLMKIYVKLMCFIAQSPYELTKALMASCVNEVICQNDDISKLIPFKTITYNEALERALSRDSQKSIFKKKKEFATQINSGGFETNGRKPPNSSKSFISDIRYFLINKPKIPTLIKFSSTSERDNYRYRIVQRLGIEVSEYKILNIHQIGIDAPSKYIFDELMEWDGDSSCWPNHIAKVVKQNNSLETLFIYPFGWTKFPKWIEESWIGLKFKPLFALNAIKIKKIPDFIGSDNARFLLYKSSGGYPIGVFTMYVRSSIPNQQETEHSQLFLMVGFNFYGKEKWSKWNILNKFWESIHDRVTANVLFRLKQLSEWRFSKLKEGKLIH